MLRPMTSRERFEAQVLAWLIVVMSVTLAAAYAVQGAAS